jgi:starch synthase
MNKINILFATSEAAPFIATGGLGEVSSSLPKALKAKYGNNIDIRIILPLYKDIEDRSDFEFVGNTIVDLAWRQQYCEVFKKLVNGVTYYFIGNEYYFKRNNCYGHFDDGERFAFFSKAILSVIPMLDFSPDIIHTNDWQTALVPIYLKTTYANLADYSNIKTIFTIHNIEYQGIYNMKIAEDIFDIHGNDKSIVEFNKSINLVKGALETCDIISTVSESYAREIFDDYYAHGLASIINRNAHKVIGILNGIDTEHYNPETDKALFENYNINSIQKKYINKTNLQKLVNLPKDEKVPVIGIVSRLVKHKGFDLIIYAIDEILKEKVQFIILGKGDRNYELHFKALQDMYKNKLATKIDFNQDLARKLYAGADFILMPSISEPCGIAQMIASRYATVPIVRETGGLKDSIKDCSLGAGNGFTFHGENPHELVLAIKRALQVYANENDFRKLIETVMSVDFSWEKSAQKYFDMYNNLNKQ